MSSLFEDLDDLIWPVRLEFDRGLTPLQWYEFDDWCNTAVGPDNWRVEKNTVYLKKEEHATLFLLRWT